MGLEAMRAASSNGALGSGDSWVTDLLSQAQTAKRGQSWYPGPALPPLASLHSHLIEPWGGLEILVLPQFSSVQFSRSVVSYSLRSHGLQHARLPYPSPTPGVYSNSCPLSQ